MRVLLDTHIVYWTFYETKRLPQQARQLIVEADQVYVSPVSVWEIAIKIRVGKMSANPLELVDKVQRSGFIELRPEYRHVIRVADLPLHHSDPFDRLLIAQALTERLIFLTSDSLLEQYSDLVRVV